MTGWARAKLGFRVGLLCAIVLALHTVTTVVLVRSGIPIDRYIVSYSALALLVWVAGTLLLIDRTVLRPLHKLANELDQFSTLDFTPQQGSGDLASLLSHGIHRLTLRVRDDAQRLSFQQDELQTTKQNLTRAEQLALVGQLSAGLAHEIGNPLGAVMGYVKLLDDERDEALRHEITARIDTELTRIHRLVRELLDFARPSPMRIVPTDAAAVCHEALSLLSHQANARHCKVNNLVTPGRVHADPDRLKQVLLNLLLNAAEAMSYKGELTIRSAEQSGWLVIAIEDAGPGFSKEALARATEPFFTTKKTGSGLGLAVCTSLVNKMGGRIELSNREEHAQATGAIVSVYLRAAQS